MDKNKEQEMSKNVFTQFMFVGFLAAELQVLFQSIHLNRQFKTITGEYT